jgi:fructose-bisphosphate aldolase class II
MNVDTDTQWAYWEGLRIYYENKKGYLQTQVGNPEGETKPNKKHYDPRVFIRECEKTMSKRVQQACDNLGNVDRL